MKKFFNWLIEILFTDINKSDRMEFDRYNLLNMDWVPPAMYGSIDDIGSVNFKCMKSIFRNDLNEKTQEKED